MKTLSHSRDNRLLAALPDVEWRRWLPHLEPIDMALSHAYFPTTAIVSMLYVMQDGDSAEIAVIGNEGWSVFRFSWAAAPHQAGQLSKMQARVFG